LSGLGSEPRHPDGIAEYVKTYYEERKRLAPDSRKQTSRHERRVGEISMRQEADAIQPEKSCPGKAHL